MNRLPQRLSRPAKSQGNLPGKSAAFCLLACLLLLAACGGGENANQAGAANNNATSSTASSSASSSAQTLSGDCANPFYPVSAVLKRRYTSTYAGGGLPATSYTESFTEITPNAFKLQTTLEDGSTITHGWSCTGGGLAALEYAQLNFNNQGGMKMDVETLRASGVMIPAAANWQVGYKWKTEFDILGKIEGAGAMGTGEMKATVTLAHEIVGEEPVTVPAGTFNTFKVQTRLTQTGTMSMSAGRGGPSTANIPLNTSLDMVMYHAKGVGLVKSIIEKTATTELTSITPSP